MYGIRWLEFNKDQLVMKEKYFETEKALNKFIENLHKKVIFTVFMQFVNNWLA